MPKLAHNMHKWLFLTLLLFIPPLSGTLAATPEEKGLAIVTKADELDTGWKDQKADMDMVLRNRQGEKSTRSIRMRTLEVIGDGDKSLTIFDTPNDVKGTAFLSHTHATKPDDQWLYMPSLKRIKRISSSNKSGPFMGSEFAYEDLSSQEIPKYKYKWLQDETLKPDEKTKWLEDKSGARETFVVEHYPQYEGSGYKRLTVWVDKEVYRPLKIEFFDRKNAKLKTLTFTDYQQYEGRYYRPYQMKMVNHQTGKSTVLTWKNYEFDTGLDDSDFKKGGLKREW